MNDLHVLRVLSADRQASLRAAAARRPRGASRRSSRRDRSLPALVRRSGALTLGVVALVALGAVG